MRRGRDPGWERDESPSMIAVMSDASPHRHDRARGAIPPAADRAVRLPDAPFLAVGPVTAAWLTPDGEIETVSRHDKAAWNRFARHAASQRPVLCHAPAASRRLGGDALAGYDILELFAFVLPARFCVPTINGVADALDLPRAESLADAPMLLRRCAFALLGHLKDEPASADTVRLAMSMARGGWPWGPAVLAALGSSDDGVRAGTSGLDIWRRLPEWPDQAPPPPPGDAAVDPAEARARLADLLGDAAESRPSQADYASAVTAAFAPRDAEDVPHFVMAEAGTGVGKTLGYIAPASVWAQKNEGAVWISTYTRNLQHQIDRELDRLYPNPADKRDNVVVRKGRENYLCLLNYEEAVAAVHVSPGEAAGLGLLARWIWATRDGDISGGDFPSWLSDLIGVRRTLGLADRRGECIYSACSHYSRCFVERSVRRSRYAEIVVANHALVMVQAARGGLDLGGRTTRFVFDEGHHVFDAADGAFSAHLSGMETAELRRWLRGAETRSGGRARGLRRRLEDVATGETAQKALDRLLHAAAALPGEGWRQRVNDGRPAGPVEALLSAIRRQVYARATGVDGPYALEVGTDNPVEGLEQAAADLRAALGEIVEPARALAKALAARLDEEADQLDTTTRIRLEAAARSLEFRCIQTVEAWREMLSDFKGETPESFVDWLAVDRLDGRDVDVGMRRHWVDPMIPFAGVVARPAHGVLVTSATLTDGSAGTEAEWETAELRTGAHHLAEPALRVRVSSPFDYPAQTRVVIVNDVRKDDLTQVAAAYRELFKAAGGGGLGLFTAISRLRAVYQRIVEPLTDEGLALYAQHVDNLNLASLVDIFRAETHSSLLGTDALRDGVDVPGDALRLIVFDRVPWPRPTLLHKARRSAFSGRAWDDGVTRLRLKQAFGRLVRRGDDRGVFVLLDPMTPSRLLSAFPDGVSVEKIGLAEAVALTRSFLQPGRASDGGEKAGQEPGEKPADGHD